MFPPWASKNCLSTGSSVELYSLFDRPSASNRLVVSVNVSTTASIHIVKQLANVTSQGVSLMSDRVGQKRWWFLLLVLRPEQLGLTWHCFCCECKTWHQEYQGWPPLVDYSIRRGLIRLRTSLWNGRKMLYNQDRTILTIQGCPWLLSINCYTECLSFVI